jgi:hypothetical protein
MGCEFHLLTVNQEVGILEQAARGLGPNRRPQG